MNGRSTSRPRPRWLCPFALVATSCLDNPDLTARLTMRLETLDQVQRPALPLIEEIRSGSRYTDVPDAHGTVVLRVRDRVAVRLDSDVAFPPHFVCMAIHSERGYQGELLVIETWRGHALGKLEFVAKGAEIAPGDRASCKP